MSAEPPRTPHPSAVPGIFDRALQGGGFRFLRRIYRWFNLTVIQHAIWPLAIAVFDAPQVDVQDTPWNWFAVRLAGPALAALVALLYIRRARMAGIETTSLPAMSVPEAAGGLAQQARYVLLGLPFMVLAARLFAEPVEEIGKIALFGLAQVAAYHLINFWIVPLSFPTGSRGLDIGTVLFGISWGLGDLLRVGATSDGSLLLAFLAGTTAGLLVAMACRLIRRWPGGTLTAAAAQWLVISLILGFTGS